MPRKNITLVLITEEHQKLDKEFFQKEQTVTKSQELAKKGNSLVVQRLGLCIFTAGGVIFIPARRIKISQAVQNPRAMAKKKKS